jgi:hypothetical protein
MPLFPLPALIALAGWVYVTTTAKPRHIAIAAAMLLAGAVIYLVQARKQRGWPFQREGVPESA